MAGVLGTMIQEVMGRLGGGIKTECNCSGSFIAREYLALSESRVGEAIRLAWRLRDGVVFFLLAFISFNVSFIIYDTCNWWHVYIYMTPIKSNIYLPM